MVHFLPQEGQDVLTNRICLFEVRVARQDEFVQPERVVLAQSLCHLFMASHKRRSGAGPDEADPGPEVRTDLEFCAVAAMQRKHPLLANRFAL